jgi:5'(3')-deoxyribonucleotidase
MSKDAVVDVDNTLCDFAPVFYEELVKYNPEIPKHTDWNEWDFYHGYMCEEDFFEAAHNAQMRIMECAPLDGADSFMRRLQEDFNVLIASHRREESRELLARWMKKHNIRYDDIHISYDKTKMFNGTTKVVIDDSPKTLNVAYCKGILATGLEFPWNSYMRGTVYLANNLFDIGEYICGN